MPAKTYQKLHFKNDSIYNIIKILFLGINLREYVQGLYLRNYNILLRKLFERIICHMSSLSKLNPKDSI